MGWNHRVIATEYKGEIYLQIHEVYYDDNGKPDGMTENPITIGGEDLEGIKWVVDKLSIALEKPTLWGDERFPEEYKPTDQ